MASLFAPVCTSSALAGGTRCLFLWDKERAWSDCRPGEERGGRSSLQDSSWLNHTLGEVSGMCLPVADRIKTHTAHA